MRLSPDLALSDIIFVFVFFAILGLMAYLLFLKDKEEKNRISWFQEKIKELDIDNINGAKVFFESNFYCFLIYTKSDFIYIVDKGSRRIEKVLKKDILDVDVDVYTSEKNTKRLIALTSTYDKSIRLDSIILKITTENGTYKIPCLLNGKDGNKVMALNKNSLIEEVNRIKLILEKDINKLNTKN